MRLRLPSLWSALDETAFAAFWTRYPNKRGKEAARQAWARLKATPAVLQAIDAALDWQVHQRQWTADGGEFIPRASTWLNGKRWEDERTVVPATVRVDWRAECETLHGGRCGNVHFHAAKMAEAADA